MSAAQPNSRAGDPPFRVRTLLGWGVVFAIVIIGIFLFLLLGNDAPVLHDVGGLR